MKILVTGAAGFIASHLSEKLHELGHEVIGLDCFSDYYSVDLKKLNEADLLEKGIKIHKLDLAVDDLSEIVKDVDVVFHLAAQPGISASVPFEIYERNNVTATFRLLEALRLNNPNLSLFVNIATSSVYGVFADSPEDVAPKPTSYYGVTKLSAEQLALSYFREKVFPACSCRLFSVYGPRERPEKIYPKLIMSILEDKEFPLFDGSEKHLRSYTYVGDIVDGFIKVLENKDKVKGEIFNLGLDTAITTGEGIEIVEDILGKKAKISIRPKRPGDQTKTEANIKKAREILGYDPKTSPREGLTKTVEWFKSKIHGKIEYIK